MTYESVKARVDLHNAYVRDIDLYMSRHNDSCYFTLCDKKELEWRLRDYRYDGDKPIYRRWLDDVAGGRREYRTVDFLPGRPAECGVLLNLYQGPVYEPRELVPHEHCEYEWIKPGLEALHRHLREYVCDGDRALYEYMLDWEAHLVQRPWQRPGVALVFFNNSEDRENSYRKKLYRLVGRAHVKSSKAHVEQPLQEMGGLVNMFDCTHGGYGRAAIPDRVLRYIDDDRLYYSMDNGAVLSLNNCSRVIMELRQPEPYVERMPARTYPITVNVRKWSNNNDFFKRYYEALEHEACVETYYSELMRRDITEFSPSRGMPRTPICDKLAT